MPEETVKPTSFREHYEAAKSAADSQGKSADEAAPETPAADDTRGKQEPPAEETEKVADLPAETTESKDELLPAEEVAKLSPKERTAYEKSQKSYTLKTQALAAEREKFKPWQPLISGLTDNPDETIEQLATARGFKLVKADQDTNGAASKQETENALAELPAELEFARPFLEQWGNKLVASAEARLKDQIKPVIEGHERIESEALDSQIQTTLKQMTDKHPGWEKHQAKVYEFMCKLEPKGMTPLEYMETCLTLATQNVSAAEQTKKTVERINKSASAAEPPVTPVSDKLVVHAMPPPDKRSIRDAHEAAKRGERWAK